jgi:hypothetical protein
MIFNLSVENNLTEVGVHTKTKWLFYFYLEKIAMCFWAQIWFQSSLEGRIFLRPKCYPFM